MGGHRTLGFASSAVSENKQCAPGTHRQVIMLPTEDLKFETVMSALKSNNDR